MSTESKAGTPTGGVRGTQRGEAGRKKAQRRPRKLEPEEMQKILQDLHPSVVNRLRRLRALGMHHRQVVSELHCREGRSLGEIAEVLGLSRAAVADHWRKAQEMLAQQAPRTAEEFTAMREGIAARLWATVEQTHGRTEVVGKDGEVTTVEAPPTPQLLAIRLRTLEQISKLYGICGEGPGTAGGGNGSSSGPGSGSGPSAAGYVTPEALAELMQQRRLELHGREAELLDGVDGME